MTGDGDAIQRVGESTYIEGTELKEQARNEAENIEDVTVVAL